MSLVNDMLNDLEQRRGGQQNKPMDLGWMMGQSSPSRRRALKPAYIASAIAAVTMVAIVAWWYRPAASLQQAEQILNPPVVAEKPPRDTRPYLNSVNWSAGDHGVHLQLTLDALKPYTINRDGERLSIRLYGARSRLNAKTLKPLAPVTAIDVQSVGKDLLINLVVAGDFSFSDQLHKKSNRITILIQPQLAQEEAPAKPATAQPPVRETATSPMTAATSTAPPQTVRTQLTLSQRDMQLAKQAEALIRGGDLYQAENKLDTFVTEHPNALRSGKLLATLWLSQRRFEASNALIESMLGQAGGDIGLRLLKARLLMARGEPGAAVEWLMAVKPPVLQHRDYYELLGLAARKNQQYPLSEQVYRGLLDSDHSRGDWWVGLGIALDAQAKNAEARSAFQRALAIQNTSAPLQQYAQQRLATP